LIAHASEPKQHYYGKQLPSGQMFYSTDCAETVLTGMKEWCPTAFMADDYPVVSPPPPGGLESSCTYKLWGVVGSCGGYGGAYYNTITTSYSCGKDATLTDGTCDTEQKPKNLGKPCPDTPKQPEGAAAAPVITLPDNHNIECGNPINSATGNKLQTATDYLGHGPFPLRFARHYNSAAPLITTPIGARWRHSYGGNVQLSADGLTAQLTRADGRVYRFKLVNGAWGSDWDVNDKLTRLPDNGWRNVNSQDETETYNAAGQLVAIANRAGVSQTLSYDALGRLTQVADAFGRTLAFGYVGDSALIASMTDPGAGQYQYAYDALGNLISATYPDGKTRQYVYENPTFPYALTGIVDENGARYATFGYDGQGRANLSEHAGGVDRVTIVFDDASQTKRSVVTDALGVARTYDYAMPGGVYKHKKVTRSCSGCPTVVESETLYNGDGTIYGTYDANRVFTRRTYDARNLPELAQINFNGGNSIRGFVNAWHSTFRLPTRLGVTSPGAQYVDFTYDASGSALTRKVTTYDIEDIHLDAPAIWTYTYNSHGQVLTEDGPRADVVDKTTYAYDAQGNLATVINAHGHATQLSQYDAHGRVGRIVDPNGLVTSLAYDARGRLVSRTTGSETTTYQYDGVGQLSKVTLPNDAYLTYQYDAAHRLTGVQDNLGNRVAYTLDAAGNRTKEDTFDPGNALRQTQTRVFDALSRLQQNIGAAGQTTAYAYDNNGNALTVTDPLGGVTTNA
jgi:YD repeat-containing protein